MAAFRAEQNKVDHILANNKAVEILRISTTKAFCFKVV
jgi:hypothetical protein